MIRIYHLIKGFILGVIQKSKTALKILFGEGPSALWRVTLMRNRDPLQYQFDRWLKHNTLTDEDIERLRAEAAALKFRPVISILTPVYNVDKIWLDKAIESVRAQVYPEWELCLADDASTESHVRETLEYYAALDPRIKVTFLEENQGISGASNAALALAGGEFVGLLDNDDELTPDALYEVAKLLGEHPDADMVYSDEDKLDMEGGRLEPFFKPDWNPDQFFCHMYTCHFGVYRREIVERIGGFRIGFEGSQDYDLVLRLIEETGNIFHIPKILYHWRKIPGSTAERYDVKDSDKPSLMAIEEAVIRRNPDATVEKGLRPGTFRVRAPISGDPLVSIIIPTKDNAALLKACVESVIAGADYPNYEILVVDNMSREPDTKAYLRSLEGRERCRVIPYAAPFNFAAINNEAAREARGDFLLFLNNDTEVMSGEWLVPMLEFAQRPDVGAVGARLLYRDNAIQHAGIILGVGGIANHAFYNFPPGREPYFGLTDVIRDCSAVTGACMMVRRQVFEELGGFDEANCPIAFNDVDLCLRMREKGYLVVYTPYAVLYHHESVSRGKKKDPEGKYMLKRWGTLIENDPYYNPNFSRERFDFSLEFKQAAGRRSPER